MSMLHRLPFLLLASVSGIYLLGGIFLRKNSPSITFSKVSGNFILPPAVYMVQVLSSY